MDVIIRSLTEADIPEARRIFSLAFATFVGAAAPTFRSDLDYVGTRWKADPEAAFVAEVDGLIAGSNFATNWGTAGFFGPLTIRPDLWDRGIGQRLMAPVLACFDRWGTAHSGLYTFPGSVKHVSLYQKFGFWPRALTAIMGRDVGPKHRPQSDQWQIFSSLHPDSQAQTLDACRQLTGRIYPGLRVEREIQAVRDQQLGDTVLVEDQESLGAFAVCHVGPDTEAGADTCYVKFGAARTGNESPALFCRLLAACEGLARSAGVSRLVAGVSTARHRAYRLMLESGFRTESQGIRMHRPNEPGHSRDDDFVIDDWR